jgi:hypothetical protein
MFEAIQTKLPHYVLPAFPFLALLTGRALLAAFRGEYAEWERRRFLPWVALWSVMVIAMGAGPWLALWPGLKFDGELPYSAMGVISVGAVMFAAVVFTQFAQRRVAGAAKWMAATSLVLMGMVFALYLPRAGFLHLSEDVGAFLREIGATRAGEVVMIDYKEDSLPFYQGGTIRPQRLDNYLAVTPYEEWPEYFVMTRGIWEKTPEDVRDQLHVLKTFRGWAYAAKGRVVEVLVVEKR